jgi:hypothetical protein
MTLEKAIEVLTAHNIWRRGPGDGSYFVNKGQDPKEIGLAIDFAIAELEQLLTLSLKTEKQDETPGSTPN